MKETFKKNWVLLLLIVGLGIFFRVYNFEKGFSFAHDQDLYSWIAKDILVNHHLRLAGQITSVDGVFIGPLYYYLMAGTYALFNMNPLSAIAPLTLIGIINIISVYWIFKRFFGEKIGLIGAFIEAVSFGMAAFDRWSVPTEPTILWAIWFLFIILEFSKGRLRHLWLYALLVASFWSIHIALLPILPIPILSYLFSKGTFKEKISKMTLKNLGWSLLIFFIAASPMFIFEIKHNFSQTKSIIAAMQNKAVGPMGEQKLEKVLNASGKEFQQRLIFGWEFKEVALLWVVILLCFAEIILRKKIDLLSASGLMLWIFLIMLAQFTSKRVVSEYYFSNLLPGLILIFSVFLGQINNKIISVLGLVYLGFNLSWLVNKSEQDMSYYYRKEVTNYIKSDAAKNNYPCIAINYIADPGFGVGFRYLFWYSGVRVIKSSSNVPIYNIVIPWQISEKEINAHYGRFGVIKPKNTVKVNPAICQDVKYNLDPLLGYTE